MRSGGGEWNVMLAKLRGCRASLIVLKKLAHSVAGAENHCTLAAVSLVPPIQVDLIILPIVQQVGASAYLWCGKSLHLCCVRLVATLAFADIWLEGIVCIWMIYCHIGTLILWGPAWTSSDFAWLHRYMQLEKKLHQFCRVSRLDDTSDLLE